MEKLEHACRMSQRLQTTRPTLRQKNMDENEQQGIPFGTPLPHEVNNNQSNSIAIIRNKIPIPVEGFLTTTIQRTITVIILININHTVALLHFARTGRNQVNAAPRGIPD